MSKILLYNEEARRAIYNGVEQLANAVQVTLGPRGRNVVIDRKFGAPTVTKDGVTVAKEIELEDPFENMGAQMVKEVATKTNDVAGDGPQPLYSKVLTPKGFIPMGDIKVGMFVCGTDGSIQTVLGVFPKGKKEIYEAEFFDDRIVECCKDHLWEVTTNYGKTKTLTVDEIIKSGRIQVTDDNNQIKHGYFVPATGVEFNDNIKDQPLDAYLLGLLLGDGSLSGTGSIELSLGYKKEHTLSKMILPEGISTNVQDVSDRNCYRVKLSGINSEGLTAHKIVESLGLLGTKSATKFIPKSYLYSSKETREKLLQGLLDTDGHINKRGLFEYSTVSESLAKDILELCRSLGKSVGMSKLTRTPGSSYSMNPIYRIIERKGFKYGVKLLDIKPTGKFTEMQCIKVSNPDNLYITDDYIVTHNTTTATILAAAIYKESLRNLTAGANPMSLKKGIDIAVTKVVEYIESISKEIVDKKEIAQVASVSANNDPEIGNLIASAMDKVGKDGVITVEEAKSIETHLEVVEGMQFDRGYLSPYMANNQETMQAVLEDAYILIYDKKISSMNSLLPILEQVARTRKPLLIIAEDIESDALSTIIINNLKKVITCVAVKAPGFGDVTQGMLEDIAVLTKGQVVSKELGMKLEEATEVMLGSAKKIVIDKDSTTIVQGAGSNEEVIDKVEQIEKQIKLATSDYVIAKLQERKAKLAGGVAVINVGAPTEIELKEKKARVEDSLEATKAAVEEGIVAGGGLTLLNSRDSILEVIVTLKGDEKIGAEIILRAIEAPMRQIAINAGLEGSVIVEKAKEEKEGKGFNAYTLEWVDMVKLGIIDPAKVVRTSLQNAASVAGMLSTTEVLISDKIRDDVPVNVPPMGGIR